MKVSFGKLVYRSENKNNEIKQSQKWIMSEVNSAFGYSDVEYAYGKDEMSGKELTFDQFLERKKNTDVVVTAKRNGRVNVTLMKKLKDKSGSVVATFPVKNQYGQVLTADFWVKNLVDPAKNIPEMIAKFRKRCIHWAMQAKK